MDIVLSHFKSLTPNQIHQLSILKEMYGEWNNKINVISRQDFDNFYTHHILHSLSLAYILNKNIGLHSSPVKILDIGTGGGFPGVPLAILYPQISFVLVDSIQKKINVVNDIIKQLQLKNVQTIADRIEKQDNLKVSICVSRAVAPLTELVSWVNPIIINHKNPFLFCLKGGNLEEEIKPLQKKYNVELLHLKDIIQHPFFETKCIVSVNKK